MSDQRLADPAITLFTTLLQIGWTDFFDPGSLERGLRYARQGRVASDMSLEVEDDMIVLGAELAGSGKQPYVTEISVEDGGDGDEVFTACTCPVGVCCKHAVALIQTYLEQMERDITPPDSPRLDAATDQLTRDWEAWLGRLESAASMTVTGATIGDEYRLGLFLDSTSYKWETLLKVLPVWLRPSRQSKRHGGWVSPQIIEVSPQGLTPAPAKGWPAAQEDALSLLLHGNRDTYWAGSQQRHWVVVSKPFQARALWALLNDPEPPLLFFQKQTGARLEQGPGCALTLNWQPDAEGNQYLQADTQPSDVLSAEALVVRLGHELCYIDPGTGLFGSMAGSPELLRQLNYAPPLPPAMSDWLGERLRHMPALAEKVPLPKTVEERTLEGVAPRIMVTMRVANGQLSYRDGLLVPQWIRVGAAEVGFDYDGAKVTAHWKEVDPVFQDGQRITVYRDKAAETAQIRTLPLGMLTLESLMARGAVPDKLDIPAWSLLLPSGDAPPSSAAEWPSHLAGPDGWWDMITRLREAGCWVEFSDEFPEEPRYLAPEVWHGELEPAGNGWFDLALDIEVEGQRLNLLPILRQLLKNPDFPLEPAADEPDAASWTLTLDQDRRLVLPLSRLRSLMAPILDWLNDEADPQAALQLPLSAAERVAPLAEHERWAGREDVSALARRLKALPASLPAPEGFVGELRDYQSRGLAWLRFLSELETGGILADDMGLGKTVQVLAHLLDERARGVLQGPTLVVAPTSLVGNWCAEAARFAPGLTVLALQGSKAQRRRQLDESLPHADLVVTTYPLLIRDLERLRELAFGLLVLDEAQAIKNAASQTARAVRELNAGRALAMTGTPLENHLGELWAQLDAVAPGALGSQQWFGQHFRTPIEKGGDATLSQRLSRRISPLMLRRTKQQVLGELPDKTESRREITLTGTQRELYESLRLAQHQRVQQAIAERGLAGSGIVMLDALLKLRQVCCDPRLVKLDSAKQVRRSAKLDQLRELLPPLIEEGRRILVFSQFTEMLGLIGQALERDGIPYTSLTGDTPGKTRTQRVALFQQGEIPVFLISLKAGGTGLNLTAADTVIHYDPWWNPAVEAQATGRAHRMGQQNPVFVYKLVCAGTVEERILDLQARKADLAASILEGGAQRQGDGPLFDEQDLALLFAPVA
ncbi:DEAD/DEAH box helicase [Halomonas sp.]|uniref:DEAD/DEAH box helicase n=1 Tax=Halomonas sp. TaxID=1486246 RepID=UPI00298E2337|nr:DEAD/DEAH box helicase [Halomonas sp.]MDW7745658.1 DEAD/DEAH box helicase [Halomonas sp.]